MRLLYLILFNIKMMNINMQYLICNVNMHACEKIIDNCTNRKVETKTGFSEQTLHNIKI